MPARKPAGGRGLGTISSVDPKTSPDTVWRVNRPGVGAGGRRDHLPALAGNHAHFCQRSLPVNTPTPNQTQVQQTIAAIVNSQITATATAVTETASPSPTSLPTQALSTPQPTLKITPTMGPVTQTSTPVILCDQAGAGNPIDVTIPDDTVITAGQSFVKTWKLVNTGTCTWTSSYSATFFYGDRMGAPESVPLKGNVLPSQNVEISVEMVAPQSPGTYQGNWKMTNPEGELFGIGPNGNLPFWVRIVVAANPTTPTSTSTLSVTTTPRRDPDRHGDTTRAGGRRAISHPG